MKNEDVIRKFLKGEQAKTPLRDVWGYGKGRTLYTCFNVLVNYDTNIAIYFEDTKEVLLNVNKYSVTTTKIQNTIRRVAEEYGLKVVECEGL